MEAQKSIILVGLMGSGKTTVGKLLSEYLGWEFVDTDQLIIDRSGLRIQEIFAQLGEEYFRRLEEAVIAEAVAKGRRVVATGGGAVTSGLNRKNMKENGVIVYLKTSPEQLVKRTGQGADRPLLVGEDRLQVLSRLLAEREEFYVQGDLAVVTDGLTAHGVVERILKELKTTGLWPE